jgi:surfeit locus 1 family protein
MKDWRGQAAALVWPMLLAALCIALLVSLGLWQLHRRAWKENLIRLANERSLAPPQSVPPEADWPRLDRQAVEYRRVSLAGTFRHQDEVLVFTTLAHPRGPIGGVGFWVVTPLVRDDGSVVLVNRGFVPARRQDRATRTEGLPQGRVELVGLMRWSEDRTLFTPADDPGKGVWFTRDAGAMARARGLARVAPFFVEAEARAAGGLPQGGETRLVFANRHLEYALTWFGLAATLVIICAAFAWTRRRQ